MEDLVCPDHNWEGSLREISEEERKTIPQHHLYAHVSTEEEILACLHCGKLYFVRKADKKLQRISYELDTTDLTKVS